MSNNNNNNNQKKLTNALQNLLEKNYDATQGYEKLVDKVDDSEIQSWIKSQIHQRHSFIDEIKSEIKKLNEEPKESGSFTGSAHRFWIDIKSTLSTSTDQAILEECLRGEKASVEEYEEQLKMNYFTPDTRSILNNHKSRIETAIEKAARFEEMVS